MIEDLPLRILKEIGKGGYSPVLPIRVTNENGEVIESRSRFAFIRMDSGEVDVVFYPTLKSSPLECQLYPAVPEAPRPQKSPVRPECRLSVRILKKP